MSATTTCRDGVSVLFEYLEGTLGSRRRNAVDRHVAGCPRCQRFIASYATLPRLVRRATAAAPPAGLRRRLFRRLTATNAATKT